MPQVPTLDHFGAAPAPLPGVRQSSAASPDLLGASADQQTRLGNAVVNAGAEAVKLAAQMQEQADQVREDDALNRLRQRVLDLTYDEKIGYAARKGRAAFDTDDAGLSLSESYTGKLQRDSDEIAAELGNDNQRRNYLTKANNIVTHFRGGVLAHMRREGEHYALTTQAGTVRIGHETALANWSDASDTGPRQEAINSVKSAIAKTGQLTGEGASETVSKMLTAESAIHLGVIDSAIANSDFSYAIEYFKKYGREGNMAAKDILRAQEGLRKHANASIVMNALGDAIKQHAPAFAPSEFDRLTSTVLGLESGSRDVGPDGKPLTSPKGAKYAMQVMPDTARNPGFGIAPAKNESAEEYNRVGRQYLSAMVTKYGNSAQALAAYNAGPQAVDEAISKAKAANAPMTWLSYLPKEAQQYVRKGESNFTAGVDTPKPPSELEFVQSAIDRLPASHTPEMVKLTRESAEHHYKLVMEARKQRGDQAEHDAQQALIANGGDFVGLDPAIKINLARFDPQAYTRVQEFAKKINGATNTNLAAYSVAVAHPDELAKMSEPVFLDFMKRNFTEADGKHVANLRAERLTGKVSPTADSLDSGVINSLLEEHLPDLGIDAKPKRDDTKAQARIGAIQKFIREDLFAHQRQLCRKMTPKEISDRVDALFSKSTTFRNTVFGIEYGTEEKRLLALTPSDLPAESLAQIDAAFKRRGVSNPTDSDRMQAYWRLKNGR